MSSRLFIVFYGFLCCMCACVYVYGSSSRYAKHALMVGIVIECCTTETSILEAKNLLSKQVVREYERSEK